MAEGGFSGREIFVEKVQVDILGLSQSQSGSGSGSAYALILKEVDGERRLPIIIGAFEAQSIALEMEGIKPPRPLTHDLIKNLIDTLGITLGDVVINELRDGTFFARINIEYSSVPQEIDSRPSDAIAIAVRFGVPIYVAEKVMEEASFLPEDEEHLASEPRQGKAAPSRTKSLDSLHTQLKEAIEKEEYEKAARLRDEIRKIEMGG